MKKPKKPPTYIYILGSMWRWTLYCNRTFGPLPRNNVEDAEVFQEYISVRIQITL